MLIESTLREGEQRFGAYFTPAARARIAALLVKAGVRELECAPDCAAQIKTLIGDKARISVWCAARPDQLDRAATLNPDLVAVGIPVSDAHIAKRFSKDRAFILDRVREILGLARERSLPAVSLGLEDASRADPDFVVQVARLAQQEGACRIRLADTVGILAPHQMAELVSHVRPHVDLELAVHCHNDFGMATANALAALNAGADLADACLLGLGERAGVAATEQLAGFLTLQNPIPGRPGRTVHYDMNTLAQAVREAAAALGQAVPDHAPLVGERLFWVETGLHADAVYKACELYEPFDPSQTGLERRIALGKKSGRGAVRGKLHELGRTCTDNQLDTITQTLRQTSATLGRQLEDDELVAMLG